MFVLLLIIFLLYGGCVFWLLTGEKEAFLRTEEIIKSTTDTKKISLVVPFRNEEKNLKALIESLLKINYPKDCYEVIFVNDNSDDNSEEIIYSLLQHTTSKIQYSLYRLRENSSRKALKKKALITGVEHARFSIIATTDADCIIPENWFAAISKIFAKQEIALAFFPVIYTRGKCSIKKWQHIESIITTGLAAGGVGCGYPFMGSAAAMAFRKSIGITGSIKENISSGDDTFLLENILKEKSRAAIFYFFHPSLKIKTQFNCSFKDFIMQKIRWAYKSKKSRNTANMFFGALVFITNFSMFFLLLYSLIVQKKLIIALLFFIYKSCIDYLFLNLTAFRLKESIKTTDAWKVAILYPFYVTFVAVASFLPIKVNWKGRKISTFER